MISLFGGSPAPGTRWPWRPRPAVVFGRDPRDGGRALLEISSLPDVPGDALARQAQARRNVLARHAAAARAEMTGERRDPFERQVEATARAHAAIPYGPQAALDVELARAAEREAFDAEVELERRRLAHAAAPELVI